MATNFPTSLDTLTNPNPTDKVDVVSHSDQHANANDSIEALEAKVGIDGSVDTDTHDYKLSGVTGADKSASLTGTETLTNKTLTSPILTTPDVNGGTIDDADITNPTLNGVVELDLGSDATGDIYYRGATGELERLAAGTDGQFATLASGIPAWTDISLTGVSIEGASTTTHSLTTSGTETVLVIAKGYVAGTTGDVTVTMSYGGTTKDTIITTLANSSAKNAFSLAYFETPAAATSNITVATNFGSLSEVKINVIKV